MEVSVYSLPSGVKAWVALARQVRFDSLRLPARRLRPTTSLPSRSSPALARPATAPGLARPTTGSGISPGHLDRILRGRVAGHDVLGGLVLREVHDDVRLPGRHVEHV